MNNMNFDYEILQYDVNFHGQLEIFALLLIALMFFTFILLVLRKGQHPLQMLILTSAALITIFGMLINYDYINNQLELFCQDNGFSGYADYTIKSNLIEVECAGSINETVSYASNKYQINMDN